MRKFTFLIFVFSMLIYACSGNKEPVVKMGKVLDENKMEVSEETDIFNRNENFAYTLSQPDPFDTQIITRRIYEGKEYIDMIRKESVDIPIKPGENKIGESIPVLKLIQKFGSGNFLLLFTINETVIAKKSFVIEGYINRRVKASEMQPNNEIMPVRAQNNNFTSGTPEQKIPDQNIGEEKLNTRPQHNVPESPGDMMK